MHQSLVDFSLHFLEVVSALVEFLHSLISASIFQISDGLLSNRHLTKQTDLDLCQIKPLIITALNFTHTLIHDQFVDLSHIDLELGGFFNLILDLVDEILVNVKLLVLHLEPFELFFLNRAI